VLQTKNNAKYFSAINNKSTVIIENRCGLKNIREIIDQHLATSTGGQK